METIMPGSSAFCIGALHSLLDDLKFANGLRNTALDKSVAAWRVLHEGMCFLTKTLPLLGKALDAGLSSGTFICPSNFRRKKGSALPAFLHGLLARVFAATGALRSDADLPSVTELRQVLYFFYKVELPFTKAQLTSAILKFRETDHSIGAEMPFLRPLVYGAVYHARRELSELFDGFDPFDIIPSHGPGAVASGEKPHEKRLFKTKYGVLHEVYPYYRWFCVNASHLLNCVGAYRARDKVDVGTNKVVFVPKDSRGPRTIACEPLEYMYIQQGLRSALYKWIENHPMTKGQINFTDQSVNQRLARESSIKGDTGLATVDLADASDRVSWWLVRYLFADTPLIKPLEALRTPSSRLPNGEIVPLNKYAAMGSALCFPIEALVFWSLLRGISLCRQKYSKSYVYGDDIIVESSSFGDLLEVFEAVGLRVNTNKSFTAGSFKESCGHDYFRGELVSPIRLRSIDHQNAEGVASILATSNLLFERGYYRCSAYLEAFLPREVTHPIGRPDSPYLCRIAYRQLPPLSLKGARYDKKLQRWVRPVTALKARTYSNPGYGKDQVYGELLRKYTSGWNPEFTSGDYTIKNRVVLQRKSNVDIHL